MPKSVTRLVRMTSDNECDDGCKSPWWCAEEKSDGTAIAESSSESREIGIETEADDLSSEGQC